MCTVLISSCLLIINLIIVNIPLLNILSYESSALNGILLSFLTGVFWLKCTRNKSTLEIFNSILIFAIIPFVLLSLSTTLCQNCPLDDGIYFYIVLALPSIIVGVSLAFLSNYISVKYSFIIFILIWIVILFSFLPELYYLPQIYFYNPIFGYYPGVIYDQTIEITSLLLLYRIINVVIASVIIIVASDKYLKNISRGYILFILTILILIQITFSSILGFNTTLEKVKKELKQEISTEHFEIILPDTLSENQKKILELDHEFYYFSNSIILGYTPDEKIISIIYGTAAQKKKLFGSANADVAKPWLNQIYLNYDNYQNSLKHEIAHIFSAKIGVGPFKIPSSFNPGLIEGFAMAVENNYDDFDIDYLSAIAYQNNYKISLSNLFTDFSFFSNASSLSYIYAGSFFKYLAHNYGWEKLNLIYSGNSFHEVFQRTLPFLENEYYNYLDKFPAEDNLHVANYYFGRKPLIKLTCARVTAKALLDAQNTLNDEKFEESASKYLEIYNYSKSYSALVGFAISSLRAKSAEKAISLLERELVSFEGSSSFYYLEYLLADLYALNSDSIRAAKYYESIIVQNPNLRYLRNASVKLDILRKSNTELINYLNSENQKYSMLEKMVFEKPNDFSLQLLVRISYSEKEDYHKIIEQIEQIISETEYSSNTYFEISNYAYLNLDFNKAIKYADKALKLAEFSKIPIINEHIAKLNWILSKN